MILIALRKSTTLLHAAEQFVRTSPNTSAESGYRGPRAREALIIGVFSAQVGSGHAW